jgi:hypothetical protein
MLYLVVSIFMYAPEDSNSQYLMDRQIARYLPAWEMRFDSIDGGLRTSQGCLDLLNWYISLETKYEVKFSKILGLRYQNQYLGDYAYHVSDHRFQPFFQLAEDKRLFFTVTPHYYKGEDEIGVGLFFGRNYLNYLETFFIVEDFDRNYSLKNTPNGPGKVTYQRFPLKLKSTFNTYWQTGHITMQFEVTNRYQLQSTEREFTYPPHHLEKGLRRYFYSRFWQDFKKLRLGGIVDIKQSEFFKIDTTRIQNEDIFDLYAEPMITYRLNKKWIPTVCLSYNYKTEDDSIFVFGSGVDSLTHYSRNVYAYYIDVEFNTGGRFIWHFGTQQQFYSNNQGWDFKDRRFILGLEYRHKNIWFYIIEAMEGDFPIKKNLHNHTYVQLMIRF